MLIVLVDDNPTNLSVYRRLLTHLAEVEIATFASSAQAMRACLEREPDLLVLDQRMPPPDGLTFLREFRAARPHSTTPIVMLTADVDRELRHRALELGANDFLSKPADPVEFLARIRNLLALRSSREELLRRNSSLASEVTAATAEIAAREQETIERLMRAAEYRDNETGMHIVRVGAYSAALGVAIGLNAAATHTLRLAAPMHDIGKVATPDAILLKPGPLGAAEWTIMREHAEAGYRILEGSLSPILRVAAEIARGHHERWDGFGYPRRLAGDRIPLEARICAVGDVFDALISQRPYKAPWPLDRAFDEIAAKGGSHLDPDLARAFVVIRPQIEQIVRRFADDAQAA